MLEVVVAVIINEKFEVLVSKRRKDKFMSNYWEFPGGKIEARETQKASLVRELKEELDIEISSANLIHTMTHQYSNNLVKLWVYKINSFTGIVKGAEGQEILWSNFKELKKLNLLPTMRAIINRIILAKKYWITPDISSSNLLPELENKIKQGISMVQLRSKSVDEIFINEFNQICKSNNITLILNIKDKDFKQDFDGWHLSSKELFCFNKRPCAKDKILGVSTHCIEEIKHAYIIDADYISISAIKKTNSHHNAKVIGWNVAKKLVHNSNLPAYLLGGMTNKDINRAIAIGAQGIAGISKL